MVYNEQAGTAALRAEFVDGAVKGFANAMYKFKQALTIASTSAWKNTFFREQSTALSVAGGLGTLGQVPRGAQFPQGVVKWSEISSHVRKFAFEDSLLWEDILTDDIDVQSRTLYRVAEHVTKSVDDYIWDQIAESPSATATHTNTAIQQVDIAATKHWSGSSAAIIDDIHNALALVATSNYDTSNCMMFINPRDRRSIMRWLSDKGAQFPSISEDIGRNGFVGKIAGVDLIVSNSVTASYALLVVPKICGTWREAVSFRTTTIVDPYIKETIKAVEEGAFQMTDPNAIVLLTNTRGDDT